MALLSATISATDTTVSYCQYYWHFCQLLSVLPTLLSATVNSSGTFVSYYQCYWHFCQWQVPAVVFYNWCQLDSIPGGKEGESPRKVPGKGRAALLLGLLSRQPISLLLVWSNVTILSATPISYSLRIPTQLWQSLKHLFKWLYSVKAIHSCV